MQIDLTQDRVQSLAKTLRRELGTRVDQRAMLDALAKGFGYKSYAALKSAVPKDVPQTPAPPAESTTTTPEASQVRADLVTYAVLPDGFRVQVLDAGNQPIEEIQEGNAREDSMASTAPGHPGVGYRKLFVWARERARECARAYGLPEERVLHDTDLEDLAAEDLPEGVPADPSDGPRSVEVTFCPTVKALGIDIELIVDDNDDFVAQLRKAERELVDTVNRALDRMGNLHLPGAGDYSLSLQIDEPISIAEIWEEPLLIGQR